MFCLAFSASPRVDLSARILFGRLREEVADQTPFVFVFDAGKQFRAQRPDCFRTIERHLGIDLAAAEVTRLTLGFEEGFDLG